MFDAWNDGALFVNYFGHGGLDRLASEGLLKGDDITTLRNSNKTPVVTAMTCLIGRFELPGFDCLAESLLLKEGGGAVAVWAPSGLALNERSEQLAKKFYNVIFEAQTNVLGDAIIEAMRYYHNAGLPSHVLRVFNFLGDPAMVLPGMNKWRNELPFAKWKRTVFTYEDIMMPWISGSAEDPDNDGLKNFVEYALGRHPKVIDTDSAIEIFDARLMGSSSYDVILKYVRDKYAQGTECRLEVSSDLINWDDGSGYITDVQTIDNGDGKTETVLFYIKNPDPEKGACFIRLKVVFLP